MNVYGKTFINLLSVHIRRYSAGKMVGSFQQVKNSLTGATEWDIVPEDYDHHRNIARSAFADMLHDTERNIKYERALKAAIESMHAKGKAANVLDIGTGTGLLSIMAVRNGADSVIACEAFQPIAECAKKIMTLNGVSDKITLIPKRSTELTVGPDGDMKGRANILVTEVFDTELIGEGAIETFVHACNNLLEKDCITVPESAIVYGQVVECPSLQKWNKLGDVLLDGQVVLATPQKIKDCAGTAAVHDLQLSQISKDLFKPLSNPIPVFYFKWNNTLVDYNNVKLVFKPCESGKGQMVFMWWELLMEVEEFNVLSCAPWWANEFANPNHKDPASTIPWRDHWMQAVYYFPKEVPVHKDQETTLMGSHDKFSMWFNMDDKDASLKRQYCSCGVHLNYSRTHISYLNDGDVTNVFLGHLKGIVNSNSIVLDLNGTSFRGLAASKFGAKKLYILEDSNLNKNILSDYAKENNIENFKFITLSDRDILKEVTHIIFDPLFGSALLPWENFRVATFLDKYNYEFSRQVKILPGRCTLYAMPVEFADLHKIRMPLGTVEGIDHSIFDQQIENSRQISDDELEPQPLWEYPCQCRGQPQQIMTIDFTKVQFCYLAQESFFINENAESAFKVNGFAVWSTWTIGDKILNCGPITAPVIGEKVNWYPHTRQAVRLLKNPLEVTKDQMWGYDLKLDVTKSNFSLKTYLENDQDNMGQGVRGSGPTAMETD